MHVRLGIILLIGSFFGSAEVFASDVKEKVLGQSGIWLVVKLFDPFASKPDECRIQSEVLGEKGPRRKIPRIRINLLKSTLFIDPNIHLRQVIVAARRVIDKRSDGFQDNPARFLPDNILYHWLRIDDGYILKHGEQDPEFGEWAVHKEINDFQKAITRLSQGQSLFYKWTLETGEQLFEYELAGFKNMVELYKNQCL